MKNMHGYEITFDAVLGNGFDEEKVYRASFIIIDAAKELVESIKGSVEHRMKSDALDEAQLMGERRLSRLAEYGLHDTHHQSWRNL